jgi:hypothetical protein
LLLKTLGFGVLHNDRSLVSHASPLPRSDRSGDRVVGRRRLAALAAHQPIES